MGAGLTAGVLLATTAAASATTTSVSRLWAATYDGPRHGTDGASSVAVSPDGTRVFVTGEAANRRGGGGANWRTLAYDASSGSQLWTTAFDGPGHGQDIARSIAVNPNGALVYVTGISDGGASTGDDYATVAYAAGTGRRVWASRYDDPAHGGDSAFSVAVAPNGSTVYVTGWSGNAIGGGTDYATVAYDAHTGARIWAKRYGAPGSDVNAAVQVATSPDGSKVFVTGSTEVFSPFSEHYLTVAYDAGNGDRLWVRTWGNGQAVGLAVDPTGSRVFVTGYTTAGGGSAYGTVAYDQSSGARLWATHYHTVLEDNHANAIAASPDGTTVYVTGTSDQPGSDGIDYVTFAYDAATGATTWRATYDDPDHMFDGAYAIAASPDGARVYVTGISLDADSNYRYGTVAYEAATGARAWVRRYSGPRHYARVSAIAVSPDSSMVVVTGTTETKTLTDYATVAYATV